MKDVIAVIRVHKNKKASIKGSKKAKCVICKKLVWVSLATQQCIEDGTYPTSNFMCIICLTKELKKMSVAKKSINKGVEEHGYI